MRALSAGNNQSIDVVARSESIPDTAARDLPRGLRVLLELDLHAVRSRGGFDQARRTPDVAGGADQHNAL